MSRYKCILCDARFYSNSPGLPGIPFSSNAALCPLCYSSARMREIGEYLWSQNYRAKRRGLPATLTRKQWLITLDFYDWKCAYCGDDYQHMDHFIPFSAGGGTTADNCIPACIPCNCKKNKRLPDQAGFPPEVIENIRRFLNFQKTAWLSIDN